MKVLPFKIPKPKNEALVYQEDKGEAFYDQLHQHAEIQISYVASGTGTLFVGDSINKYQPGDIFVFGEYLPHAFKSDRITSQWSEMYTLFFDTNSFGKDFFKIPDLESTKPFFEKSERGIRILSNTNKIIELFKILSSQNNIEQISTLLLIMNQIIKSDTLALSSFISKRTFSDNDGKRMNAVYQYALENFREPISLDKVADVAHMSKNAFCRYFKKHTNKTFFQFLIEIRIENACRMLANKKGLPISLISDQSGFNNIANFNRKFKQLKGCSPTQFQAKF